MTPHNRCPQCGTSLPSDAPDEICPACAFQAAVQAGSTEAEPFDPAGLFDPVAPDSGLSRFGDYQLLERIARGGMGVVYRARQLSLNRLVALKMIVAERLAEPSNRERFRIEAEATARLKHDHIVEIYELGEQAGQPFFSMEWLEGGSLEDAMQRRGRQPLPLRQAADLLAAVARAVHYAHGRGLLHRDLKPANILLDTDGRPHVSDFGLAKILQNDSPVTESGQALGSPGYSSPEQVAGRHHDLTTASDVFSLGAILYELITGRRPFTSASFGEFLSQLNTGAFPLPSSLNAGIDSDLQTICLRCLDPDPSRRPASADDLARQLDHWLAHEPIDWRPITLWEQTTLWARRKPAIAALVLSLVVVASLGLAGIVAKERAAQRARKEAEGNAAAARRSAAETEAVLTFLTDKVLAAPRPEDQDGGLGWDITLRAALDEAEPGIANSFTNQPLAEARIRDAVGTTYYHLGLYAQALSQFERTVELRCAALGPTHPDTLGSQHNLANARARAGRTSEALALYEETLKLRTSTLGPAHDDTLASRLALATAYHEASRLSEAIALQETTLELLRAQRGSNDTQVILCQNNLANAYSDAGRLAEAIALQESALRSRREALGPGHPDTLASMNNLAVSYEAAGRHSEALSLARDTVTLATNRLGADHPDTLGYLGNLATIYSDAGRTDEALALYEDTRARRKATLGDRHPDTLASMNNLASAYADAGRGDDALALRQETLALYQATLGDNHLLTLKCLRGLATDFAALGRTDDAVSQDQEVFRRTRARFGPDHPDTLASANNLAASYFSAGRAGDALPLWEQTAAALATRFGVDHPDTLSAQHNLAAAYHAAGRLNEALTLCHETFSRRQRALGPDHRATLNSLKSLLRLYEQTHRLPEAIPLLEERLAWVRARPAPLGPETLTGMDTLVRAYTSAGRPADAQALRTEFEQAGTRQLSP